MWQERLAAHLRDRPAQLESIKQQGGKVVGYFPGDYVPEELILAAGAVPLCLIDGGDKLPVEASTSTIPHIFCPFSRAQIGEKLLQRNPYYGLMDMLVAPVTCQHLRKVADIWECDSDLKIFKLGVPHQNDNDFELEYFTERLVALSDRLQQLTGNQISGQKIGGAIELYNRLREGLKQLSLMRRSPSPPLSALEFVKLNHASYYADPAFMVDILESACREPGEKASGGSNAPRLLLIGPNIGQGDYKVLELVKASGADIVIEEVCEGVRYYWRNIDNRGDPIESLTKGYLRERVHGAFMRYSAQKRLDWALKLIADFNVAGVIWYELIGCECYDAESYFFSRRLAERDIPMLVLESDYGDGDSGQARTRIEAFIEIVRGGLE